MKRQVIALCLLVIGVQTGAAANRRGAKLYPDKEITADMSGKIKIFLGWVDMKDDDYAAHGYATKEEWASKIVGLNADFVRLCQVKFMGSKTVAGAKNKDDQNPAGYDLYIKFTDVLVNYDKYHLYLSMHFIDPATNQEIGSLPARPYFGNDWGLVNYLRAALDEASQKIKVEILGSEPQKKSKIPLIHKL